MRLRRYPKITDYFTVEGIRVTGGVSASMHAPRAGIPEQNTGSIMPSQDIGESLRSLSDPSAWTAPAPKRGHLKRKRRLFGRDDLQLESGDKVAVIGGGPAGSMFSFFALRLLNLIDVDVTLDIYEPRDFTMCGPAGCNHCGGIISETLVQMLATDGMVLPSSIVQRGIDSYDLHMDVGSVQIKTPLNEKRIAAVYRGNGPRNSELAAIEGFDGYVLKLAQREGANVVRKLVSQIVWEGGLPTVRCPDGSEETYQLVVVATGVNSTATRIIEDLGLGYTRPATLKTFISEYRLGKETVQSQLGHAMHVFLLDLPRLEFAALIPKGEFATLAMLGKEVDEELVTRFMNSTEVKDRFPNSVVPPNACHCFPRINVRAARQPFADRLVMIGDCGVTRLYKDGLGAAYRTAQAAATTVALHGISKGTFDRRYWPACRAINVDNRIGKFIFSFSHLIQRRSYARNAVLRMTTHEQSDRARPPLMSSVLWDLFSGSAPYRDILLRTLRPRFWGGLIWNLIVSNRPRRWSERMEKAI